MPMVFFSSLFEKCRFIMQIENVESIIIGQARSRRRHGICSVFFVRFKNMSAKWDEHAYRMEQEKKNICTKQIHLEMYETMSGIGRSSFTML